MQMEEDNENSEQSRPSAIKAVETFPAGMGLTAL